MAKPICMVPVLADGPHSELLHDASGMLPGSASHSLNQGAGANMPGPDAPWSPEDPKRAAWPQLMVPTWWVHPKISFRGRPLPAHPSEQRVEPRNTYSNTASAKSSSIAITVASASEKTACGSARFRDAHSRNLPASESMAESALKLLTSDRNSLNV